MPGEVRVVDHILLAIVIVIAAVAVIGLLIWGAVALKAIQIRQEIMKNIIKEWEKIIE